MITVHRQGFTDAQNRMIDEAVALGNKVRASLDFVSGIAAMKEPRLMTHLVQSEFLKLDLEFYRPWNPFTSAVARTDNGVIYLNRKRFRIEPYLPKKLGNAQFTDEDISHARQLLAAAIAGTLCHEYCHVLGFEHTSNREAYLERDTPYKVGDMVEMIAKNLVA